ncbi:MAG: PDZ domain-containing protein, partial [Mycobacterium sp.]
NRTNGVVVLGVGTPGPAADAGIKPGDVITAFNGRDTPTAESFISALQVTKPGDKIQLTVQRGGATQQISVTVADRPST